MQKGELGKFGEEIAANYLAGLGYLILIKNHREKFDEIDIIARHPNKTLIFCEVKTLSVNTRWLDSFMPEDHLTDLKLRKLIRGARIFIAKHPEWVVEEEGWQIDLIALSIKNEISFDLHHYENI